MMNGLSGLSGYLSGFGSGIASAIGSGCAQTLHGLIPPFQLNAARYAAQFLMSVSLVIFTWTDVRICYIQIPWVIVLSVISVLFNTAFYTAALYLPLGILMLANLSITYVGTLVFSKIFLYKQTVCFQYVAFIVIQLGQCLLLQPCFLFPSPICDNVFSAVDNITEQNITHESESHVPSSSSSSSSSSYLIGYVLVIVASMVSALRTFVYRCQVPDIPTHVVSFWTSSLGLMLSLLVMMYFEIPIIFLENLDVWFLLGHAIFAACTSFLTAHSQQNVHPMIFSILLNSKVVFSFILQFAFPQIFIQGDHNVWEFVGIVLCVLGVVLYVVINFRLEKQSST